MRDFFDALLDLSFTNFVTTKLIKILYVIALAALVLGNVFWAFALMVGGYAGVGILWLLIIGPIVVFFYTLMYRVFFEVVVVFFRIFENTRDELALQRAVHPEAAAELAAQSGGPVQPAAPAQSAAPLHPGYAPPPASEAPTQVQAGQTCSSCGAEVNPGDRFCQSCGTPVDQAD